jgi:hypothetical protein
MWRRLRPSRDGEAERTIHSPPGWIVTFITSSCDLNHRSLDGFPVSKIIALFPRIM